MIRKILIAVTIDWEDYDDVSDELIIEDAFESLILKDGVQIEIVKTETKQAAIPPCPYCGSNKTYLTEAIHCPMCATTTEI